VPEQQYLGGWAGIAILGFFMLVHLNLNLCPKFSGFVSWIKKKCQACFTYYDNKALANHEKDLLKLELSLDEDYESEGYSDIEINDAYDHCQRIKARNKKLKQRSRKDLFMRQLALRVLLIEENKRD
jgi:hypothetical protein